MSSIHGTGEVELRIKFTFKIIEMLEYERLFYNRFSRLLSRINYRGNFGYYRYRIVIGGKIIVSGITINIESREIAM